MTAIRSSEVHPFYFIYRELMYFILLLLNIFLFWQRLKKKIMSLISSHFNILKRVHKLTTITGNCITVIDIEVVTTAPTNYCTI